VEYLSYKFSGYEEIPYANVKFPFSEIISVRYTNMKHGQQARDGEVE
jgi:hypothetical protein